MEEEDEDEEARRGDDSMENSFDRGISCFLGSGFRV